MAQWLPEHSIDSQNVLENLVEYDNRDIELLLIEDLQSGLHVLLEFCPIHRDIVFSEVITE